MQVYVECIVRRFSLYQFVKINRYAKKKKKRKHNTLTQNIENNSNKFIPHSLFYGVQEHTLSQPYA